MQRYFIEEKTINYPYVEMTNNDTHHIKNVMRYKKNQEVILNTYSGSIYLAKIIKINHDSVKLEIKHSLESDFIPLNLDIGMSLIKRDKFELSLKKMTELGVKGIIPLETDYSIIKIKDFEKKSTRFKMICKESSEQTQRHILPVIYGLHKLSELDLKSYDELFFGHVKAQNKPFVSCFETIDKTKNVLFLIGPEGGFSDQEANDLIKKGFKAVSLGNTILRAETAAIYVTSIFRFMMGGKQ